MVQQKPKPRTRRTRTKHDEDKQSLSLLPKNDKQKEYIDALTEASQVIVFGPSGTGKTYVVSSFDLT